MQKEATSVVLLTALVHVVTLDLGRGKRRLEKTRDKVS